MLAAASALHTTQKLITQGSRRDVFKKVREVYSNFFLIKISLQTWVIALKIAFESKIILYRW